MWKCVHVVMTAMTIKTSRWEEGEMFREKEMFSDKVKLKGTERERDDGDDDDDEVIPHPATNKNEIVSKVRPSK